MLRRGSVGLRLRVRKGYPSHVTFASVIFITGGAAGQDLRLEICHWKFLLCTDSCEENRNVLMLYAVQKYSI